MSSPPPDSFDPDDVPFDPDDPLAPKEPGLGAAPRGPAALLDPDTRGRIEHEILYQQTKVALAAAVPRDAARLPAPVFLPVFFLALAVAAAAAGSVRQAVLLFLVGVAHELGHLAGMRAFGFRVPHLFLVPFFEAAVARLPDAAAAWKRAVVVLLGPLPGVAAGLVLYAAARPDAGTWVGDLCLTLVALNGIALLPVVPLDGGRLIEMLEPTRRPRPGAVLRLAVVVALVAAVAFVDSWPVAAGLGVLAGLVLLAVPLGYRQARSRQVLRQVLPGLPERLGAMTDAQRRKAFAVAAAVYPVPDPRRLAAVIRGMHAQAAARAADPRASVVLLAAYLLGAAGVAGYAWIQSN